MYHYIQYGMNILYYHEFNKEVFNEKVITFVLNDYLFFNGVFVLQRYYNYSRLCLIYLAYSSSYATLTV